VPIRLRRLNRGRQPRPVLASGETSWIAGGRRPFSDYAVGSLVPVVFEGYARVLHPAWASPDAPVRWETVARWSGRKIHPLAQWEPLATPAGDEGAAPFVRPPQTGGLPPGQLAVLWESLARATATPERCFIGIWEGYGWLDLADPGALVELRLDQRTFLVTVGPISLATRVARCGPGGRAVDETPTILWPADHAWFVASDPDLDSTYVGGSRALIGALLAEPGLEAWPVESTDRVTFDSDLINGTAPRLRQR
jgi:hypothetical protein